MAQIAPQIPQLAACHDGEDPAACATRFAQSFGARAFRRPLGDDEVAALMGPFNEGAATDFDTGIGLMIEALLQSPSFIFRTELGPPDAVGSDAATTLTPYETASQLSFLFRDSIPDQPLLQAAADGTLATDKGISQQVDRSLKLPEVQGNLNRIVGEWFNIRQVFSTIKADTYFAALPPDRRTSPTSRATSTTRPSWRSTKRCGAARGASPTSSRRRRSTSISAWPRCTDSRSPAIPTRSWR